MLYEVIFHFHLKTFSSSKNLLEDPRIYEVFLGFLGLGKLPPRAPTAPDFCHHCPCYTGLHPPVF